MSEPTTISWAEAAKIGNGQKISVPPATKAVQSTPSASSKQATPPQKQTAPAAKQTQQTAPAKTAQQPTKAVVPKKTQNQSTRQGTQPSLNPPPVGTPSQSGPAQTKKATPPKEVSPMEFAKGQPQGRVHQNRPPAEQRSKESDGGRNVPYYGAETADIVWACNDGHSLPVDKSSDDVDGSRAIVYSAMPFIARASLDKLFYELDSDRESMALANILHITRTSTVHTRATGTGGEGAKRAKGKSPTVAVGGLVAAGGALPGTGAPAVGGVVGASSSTFVLPSEVTGVASAPPVTFLASSPSTVDDSGVVYEHPSPFATSE